MRRKPQSKGLRPPLPDKFVGFATAADWAEPGEGPADSTEHAHYYCLLRDRQDKAMVEWGAANGYTEAEMFGANGANHELYREVRDRREARDRQP